MLDKDKVIEKMSERGFTVMSYSMINTHTVEAIFFTTDPLQSPSFGCNVYLESEEFEFMYAVPCSINVLRTASKCGSLMNDDHFNRLRSKFEEQVHVLHSYYGRD